MNTSAKRALGEEPDRLADRADGPGQPGDADDPGVDGLDLLTRRLGREIEAVGRRRVDLGELWQCLLRAEPAFVTATDKRLRLAAALGALGAAGTVMLPARSYDSGAPPLPRFVLVTARARQAPEPSSARTFPWRPELAWAAGLPLSRSQFEALRSVNAFLRDGGGERMEVPAQERSLELFGDEKAMLALSATGLFKPDRLSWGLLRCRPVHPPFVWQAVGPGQTLLVAENQATYASLCHSMATWTGGGGPSGVGLVAYGAGNHFANSVASALEIGRPVARILYFGDIDPQGLAIPARATAVAIRVGLPPVEPAAGLYELLFAHGRPARYEGGAVDPAEGAALVSWLPLELRTPAAALLQRGERLAQEWVGAELLSRERGWGPPSLEGKAHS